MAGKKDTTHKTPSKKPTTPASKKSKNPEPEILSDSPINNSEESDSQTKPKNTIRSKNKPQPEPEPEPESDEEEEDAEGEGEEEESEEEENVKKKNQIEKISSGKKLNGKVSDKKAKGKGKGKGKEIEERESGEYKLPMRRISRIIKDGDPDIRISHEATFLINKATEKFLELFAKEAYACAFLDRKNQVAYNHLSSIVAKRSRFDFLADFVPEKVKAEDALAKLAMNEK